jgi:hypothetical protein
MIGIQTTKNKHSRQRSGGNAMGYMTGNDDLKAVAVFLRNKNLALLPVRAGLYDRILNRSMRVLEGLKGRRMRSRGVELVVSEQIIENGLVLRHLADRNRTVLDFGGFESILPLQLSALGFKVTVWDQRPYPFRHPNLDVICLDLLEMAVEPIRRFDEIISISTIEHLGLGHYGDEAQPDADIRGVEILWRMVAQGGRLLVSVPAGATYSVQRGYRVYDEERLRLVFPNATSIEYYAKNGREGVWFPIPPADIRMISYENAGGQMPVEAIAFVISAKNTPDRA